MLRPTYVCGPNDPMRRDYFWIQRLLDRKPVLVPGSGDHAFHPVYAGDVARAFVALTDSPGYEFRSAELDIVQNYSGLMNKVNTKFKQTMY
jgi:nucleoside-diphosphate-sugar epimerase